MSLVRQNPIALAPRRPLFWIALAALGLISLGLVAISGGKGAPPSVGEAAGLEPSEGETARPSAATLAPLEGTVGERELVSAHGQNGAHPGPTSASLEDSVDRVTLRGFVTVPRGFPLARTVAVRAYWFEPGGTRAATVACLCDRDQAFEIKGVPRAESPWTGVQLEARAVGEGRVASAYLETTVPGEGAAPTIRMDCLELVIEGTAVDRTGRAIPGLLITSQVVERDLATVQDFEIDLRSSFSGIQLIDSMSPNATARRALDDQFGPAGSRWEGLESGAEQVTYKELDQGSPTEPMFLEEIPVISELATTDARGRFRFAYAAPGNVTLTTGRLESQGPDEEPFFDMQTMAFLVEPTNMPIADVSLVMHRSGRIEGQITRPPGATFSLSLFARRIGDSNTRSFNALDETGRFLLNGAIPGDYLFYARGGDKSGQEWSFHRRVRVSDGETARVFGALERSSEIVGRLVDGEGKPQVGVNITAFGAENRNLKRSGKTDAEGRYTLRGLYATDYRIEANGELVVPGRVSVPAGGATIALE